MDESLEEMAEDRGLLPCTSVLLVTTHPDWLSIPMFISEGIASNRFIVKELIFVEEKGIVFADFPIGVTIQDGGE